MFTHDASASGAKSSRWYFYKYQRKQAGKHNIKIFIPVKKSIRSFDLVKHKNYSIDLVLRQSYYRIGYFVQEKNK